MFEESSLMLWLLIASLALNLITMVLVIMLVRRKDNRRSAQLEQQTRGEKMAITKQVKSPAVSGVVFCRNCGKQYDSSTPECPNCQTAR